MPKNPREKSRTKKTSGKTRKPTPKRKTQPKAKGNFNAPERVVEAFITTLKHALPKALTVKQVLHQSGLKNEISNAQANELADELVAQQKLDQVGRGKYSYHVREQEYEGQIDMARDGRAWMYIPELLTEVTVESPKGPIKAFTGDRVRVRVGSAGGKRLGAIFLEVVEPARKKFVGTLDRNGPHAFFVPQERKVFPDFRLDNKQLMSAKDDDKVVVEIVHWKGEQPHAKIVEVLGPAGKHQTEMHAIIMEFGLEQTFPHNVEAEANAIPEAIPEEEINKRKDVRDWTTFTIDPEDAKDFDDALSYRELEDGAIEVGIHIADVTHYVQPGTALDEEAYDRATSVYLVDRTIPMLPERLSNNMCSLVPKQDRLAFSAIFVLNENGRVLQEWFGRTVIHSNHRFTYEQAQEVLDGKADGPYPTELKKLNELAHVLRKERFAQGSIGFETDEVRFKLDEDYKPVAVYVKERFDAHKLVEDFMLLANRRVARFVARARKKPPVPMVYRIHDVPSQEKLDNLKTFVGSLGIKFTPTDRNRVAQDINKLLSEVQGTPEQNMVSTVAIRSMPKAIYTTHNVGHYGLGFEYYSHFTSPIRRYPDVMVHRILQETLDNHFKRDADELEEACRHCSERERLAISAERASIKYKQVEYLQALLGSQQEGTVSGVTEWGMYVELDESKCEGMIPLRDLDDHYELDEETFTLYGKRSGQRFRLGDRLLVKIAHTDLVKRQADFKFVEKLS